ncbi:MAG TPA: phage baseplate assembly protein V, partial [Flavobacterium sp.]
MSLSQQVHVDIDSFDKTVIYYDLKVDQVLAGHHQFSFLWRYTDAVITDPEERDAMMRRYSGRDVIFTFTSTTTGTTLKAKGIIENLASVNRQGSSAGLQVTGISHTSYIDDMKKSRTFLDRNLQEILLDILPSETPGDFYQSASMAPTFKRRLPYSAQYNETTFEYLRRLATRHGQWFYWDGMRLQFGAIKDSKVKLVCGSSVHEFAAATHFSPQKASLAAYDYEKGAKIQATQRKVSEGSSDGLAAHMAQKQHDYFTRDMEVSAYTAQAAGQQELDEMAKLQVAAAAAYSATYSGVSYEPLGVGRAFMVMEEQVEYRLVAVSVQHLSDNHGNYRCTFTAIPADVAAPPYTDPHCFAHAESQSATVVDNNDPQGLGRIKVFFYWGTGGNQQTDWVRMVQPHSGVGKGFYFIPEIGEEVLVGFEGGNAEKPYIIGAH